MNCLKLIVVSVTWLLCASFAPAIVDQNANGISDPWEITFNNGALFPSNFDLQADSDSDGWTNEQEAAAGTDPYDALPPVGMVRVEMTHIDATYSNVSGTNELATPEAIELSWQTIVGKRYSLLCSPDLVTWIPVDEQTGDGTMMGNCIPLTQPDGSKPPVMLWKVAVADLDSDQDGLTDAEEHFLGTSPTSNDTDGDGISDSDEMAGGTDPTNSDTDGDSLADNHDADPNEILVNWASAAETSYVMIEVQTPSDDRYAQDLNDKGEVLFRDGVWTAGTWESRDVDMVTGPTDDGTFESHFEAWTYFNDDQHLIGVSNLRLLSNSHWEVDQQSIISKVSSQSASDYAEGIPFWDYMGPSMLPIGISNDGKTVGSFGYYLDENPDPEIDDYVERRSLAVLTPAGELESFLPMPANHRDEYTGFYPSARVSPSGWIASLLKPTGSGTGYNYKIALWNPALASVPLPAEAQGYFYKLNIAELPPGPGSATGKTGLVAVSGEDNDGTVFLPDSGGTMRHVPSLSPHKLQLLAPDGTGMTSDGKLWRNGKLIPMRDLSAKWKELEDDGDYDLLPLKANKSGTYLIQAFDDTQTDLKTFILLPVETVNSENEAAPELKVAKMIEFGVLNHNRTINPVNDADYFSIRVRGGATLGPISVKVSTADNPDPAYNDDSTQIDLYADGEDAVSDKMLLVSDDEDDDHPIDGIVDDALNDRSHKIQLGGNFVIDSIKVGANGPWQPAGIKTPVRVVKTVEISAVILRDKARADGGVELVPYTTVDKHMRIIKERYAQVGVKIDVVSVGIQDPPPGVDLVDGLSLTRPSGIPVSDEARSLIKGKGTTDTSDICLFYVNYMQAAGAPGILYGYAYTASSLIAEEDPYTYNAFISTVHTNSSIPLGGIVSAHELGHLLRDAGHADYVGDVPETQLMIEGAAADGILGAKRLSNSDETKIQGGSHAH